MTSILDAELERIYNDAVALAGDHPDEQGLF